MSIVLEYLGNELFFAAGFLDVKTATRMMRNYNIVYRMGLDMTALESFITANSTHHRAHNKPSSISISLVVNQLLQELDDPD